MNQMVERCPTRSYLFSWRVGQQVGTPEGERYVVTGVPADDRHVLTIQKLVCDQAGRPLRGLRERPFTVRAERDAVKVGRDCWARRVEEVERC